jgi:ribosome modulation factor
MAKTAEPDTLVDPREVERQGRVAYHFYKSRDVCPFGEDSPNRKHWLVGWQAAGRRTNRLDMPPARATGYRAFEDGLRRDECLYGVGTPKRFEWHEGWDRAQSDKQGDERRR